MDDAPGDNHNRPLDQVLSDEKLKTYGPFKNGETQGN